MKVNRSDVTQFKTNICIFRYIHMKIELDIRASTLLQVWFQYVGVSLNRRGACPSPYLQRKDKCSLKSINMYIYMYISCIRYNIIVLYLAYIYIFIFDICMLIIYICIYILFIYVYIYIYYIYIYYMIWYIIRSYSIILFYIIYIYIYIYLYDHYGLYI